MHSNEKAEASVMQDRSEQEDGVRDVNAEESKPCKSVCGRKGDPDGKKGCKECKSCLEKCKGDNKEKRCRKKCKDMAKAW